MLKKAINFVVLLMSMSFMGFGQHFPKDHAYAKDLGLTAISNVRVAAVGVAGFDDVYYLGRHGPGTFVLAKFDEDTEQFEWSVAIELPGNPIANGFEPKQLLVDNNNTNRLIVGGTVKRGADKNIFVAIFHSYIYSRSPTIVTCSLATYKEFDGVVGRGFNNDEFGCMKLVYSASSFSTNYLIVGGKTRPGSTPNSTVVHKAFLMKLDMTSTFIGVGASLQVLWSNEYSDGYFNDVAFAKDAFNKDVIVGIGNYQTLTSGGNYSEKGFMVIVKSSDGTFFNPVNYTFDTKDNMSFDALAITKGNDIIVAGREGYRDDNFMVWKFGLDSRLIWAQRYTATENLLTPSQAHLNLVKVSGLNIFYINPPAPNYQNLPEHFTVVGNNWNLRATGEKELFWMAVDMNGVPFPPPINANSQAQNPEFLRLLRMNFLLKPFGSFQHSLTANPGTVQFYSHFYTHNYRGVANFNPRAYPTWGWTLDELVSYVIFGRPSDNFNCRPTFTPQNVVEGYDGASLLTFKKIKITPVGSPPTIVNYPNIKFLHLICY